MKALHIANAIAWFANAVVWAFYAHVLLMGVASLGAMGVAIYMARPEP